MMEAIWDDLNQHADERQPPAWHGKALEAIEAAIERGEESFNDWNAVKRRIRDKLS